MTLSADGNTAIVGGPDDTRSAGAAWVWTRSGGVWTQQGAKLVGSGAVGTAQQGESVALSADGNTAIFGGYRDNNWVGAAWVWTRSGGVWNQQGAKLVGTGGVGQDLQGLSVSLSADGNNLTLLWPDSATGYRVESALSLSPPTSWSNVAGSLQTNGGFISMVLPIPGPQKFFRLVNP